MSTDSEPRDIAAPLAAQFSAPVLQDIAYLGGISDYRGVARPPLSPWTHILILSSVLVPIAVVPYLAVRRHLLSLHRKMGELGAGNAALQRDLKSTLLESAIRREEHDRLRAMLEETRRDVEKVKVEEARRELARATADERVRRDLQELLQERQRTRCVQISARFVHALTYAYQNRSVIPAGHELVARRHRGVHAGG